MFSDINLFAVLLAAVSYMGIGAAWYSPILFGNLWMQERGIKPGEISPEAAKKAMISMIVVALVMATGLALILKKLNVTTVDGALESGLLLWVALTAPPLATSVLYENQSIKVYVISIAYHLVATLTMAIILAAWV